MRTLTQQRDNQLDENGFHLRWLFGDSDRLADELRLTNCFLPKHQTNAKQNSTNRKKSR